MLVVPYILVIKVNISQLNVHFPRRKCTFSWEIFTFIHTMLIRVCNSVPLLTFVSNKCDAQYLLDVS
jgi:hypothetical protein